MEGIGLVEFIQIMYVIGLGMGAIFTMLVFLIIIEIQDKRKRKTLTLFDNDFVVKYNKFQYMVMDDWDLTKKLVLIKSGIKHETIGQPKKSKA
jgi:hypothetical protein